MPRNKIPKEKRRIKIGGTIDPELYKLFEEYLIENEIYNKSQYIENLIKQDLIKNNKIKNGSN